MPDRKPKSQHSPGSHADKTCAACGRTITWRKKWERDWDNVKFCSDACRSHKPGAQDKLLEETILRMLHERGAGKTICPSEAARTVAGDGKLSDERERWEPLMEPARAAARRLVAAQKIVITQGGHVVDASTAKGAIRLRLR
ncbi:hypothetical protein Terro_4040 [Terriglobus roseus DSM 18391]|uniref:DUF2256 and DUF3253 domain-containing protein n=1 Tax=Terriglobus roseus (strain DSM 18391 / NRRL B-41598 / KBS 63) TaxID=926566 RepID=I3ZLY0_TERRK|nr:DUF2256 and DUF3253 domain-containing protein [Terriglobus roseus]AFL90248.1 hypothetical protein Terro_4040 [Terriglobus roseus DSM 18391]